MSRQNKYVTAILLVLIAIFAGIAWNMRSEESAQPFRHTSSNFEIIIPQVESRNQEYKNQIRGVIIPHHLLATPLITETLQEAAASHKALGQEVSHVVLLAPNHFERGDDKIITSDIPWPTQFGEVQPNREFINLLIANNFAGIDLPVMEQEHGIFGLVPFLKYYFPESTITPLILDHNTNAKEAEILGKYLNANLGPESLVVVSADFAHYFPRAIADQHDKKSLAAIYNFDYDFIYKMEVDTKPSIFALLKYLELNGAQNFVHVGNKNSDDFTGGKSQSTTSYIAGYFTEIPKANPTK